MYGLNLSGWKTGMGRGRNGSPKDLIFYIYTRNHPKSTNPKKNHPWKEGEEPLYPYEELQNPSSRASRKIKESDWRQIDEPEQRKNSLSAFAMLP